MLKNFPDIGSMEAYLSSKIHGAFSIMDMQILGEYVKKLNPGDQYLEIGVDYGKSAASAVFQSPEGIKFYFCDIDDPLSKEDYPDLLSRSDFFKQEKLDTVSEFFHMDNEELAKTWDKGELAMIFIDGDHSYESVKADIQNWFPYLKSGGWMLFHDYDITSPEVQKAVDELVKNSDKFEGFFYAQDDYDLRSSIAGGRKR